MSAGAGVGHAINIFAFGFIIIPCLAMWDYFIFTGNNLMSAGYIDADAMNTLFILTIMINSLAFLFLLANAWSMIVQAKSDSSRGV